MQTRPPPAASAMMAKASDHRTLRGVLESSQKRIAELAGKELTPERIVSLAMMATNKLPALQNCTVSSIVAAVMDAARLGLEPDGVQGAIIPYKGSAQFQPMYRGLIALMHRSGMVDTIEAFSVRAADEFTVEIGTTPRIMHKPNLVAEKSKAVAYYAVAHLNGRAQFEVMAPWEVDLIRLRSPSANSGRTTPWDTDYDEMAKKTVLKRLMKKLPSSARVRDAMTHDNEIESEAITVDVAEGSTVTSTTTTAPPAKGNQRLIDKATPKTAEPAKQDGPPLDADGFPIEEPGDFGNDEPEPAAAPEVQAPAMLPLVEVLRTCPATKPAEIAAHRAANDVPERSEEDRAAMFAAIKVRVAFLRKPTEDPIAAVPAEEQPHALRGLTAAAKAGVQWCAEIVARFGPTA